MVHDILLILLGIGIGCLLGFLLTKKFMTKIIKENPPINEDMIKMLMSGMGRSVNQKQVNQMMKNFQKFNDKK